MKYCEDIKNWYAVSCPIEGIRFDRRTLKLLDGDGDGRIRTPEIYAALDFLKQHGVGINDLGKQTDADLKALEELSVRQANLDKEDPTVAEKQELSDWESRGKNPEVAVLGETTASAERALAAVEKTIDEFFTPPEDMPLVTEGPDKELPLVDHLNPRHLEAVMEFAAKCVQPLLGGGKTSLNRMEYKSIKSRFAAYREWIGARPITNRERKQQLEEEERLLRYKLYLGEFLENYISMEGLYGKGRMAVFQTGTLRMDGREMSLCFHVESEAAHSALAANSNCCVIYLKLARPSEKTERLACAVVTAGRVGTLYVGRNGAFYDRDGVVWEAVITKVIENQVSLAEAFWSPWKKIGEGISGTIKKLISDKQVKSVVSVEKGVGSAQAGGAALASSVAAIGIGVGMIGAAAASVISAIKGLHPWWMIFVAIGAIILAVSLPSAILAYFKLRRRDLGAILNASGWAINRPMRFSMRRAAKFTVCRGIFN